MWGCWYSKFSDFISLCGRPLWDMPFWGMSKYCCCALYGDDMPGIWPSKGANSGVMGEGVCMVTESELSLRTSRGMAGEPMGEDV